jgi:hypothetical protein
MSSVTAMKTMLERLGFSDAAADYLTGASGIDSLDEIRYLDRIDDIDSSIKGVTNPGGTVTTGTGIPVSIRAMSNLKLLVYYLKHMERVQRKPVRSAINLDQQSHEGGFKKTAKEPEINDKD